jgi:hypothetical protein
MPAENKEYQAEWTANKYTIIFHSNNGEELSNEQSFTYDIQSKLNKNSYSKEGFRFL